MLPRECRVCCVARRVLTPIKHAIGLLFLEWAAFFDNSRFSIIQAVLSCPLFPFVPLTSAIVVVDVQAVTSLAPCLTRIVLCVCCAVWGQIFVGAIRCARWSSTAMCLATRAVSGFLRCSTCLFFAVRPISLRPPPILFSCKSNFVVLFRCSHSGVRGAVHLHAGRCC